MTGKRSKLEIWLDILKAINKDEHKPTKIMYMSNLSWNPMTSFLDQMIDQGLITREMNKQRSTYFITDKGKEIIDYLNKATSMLNIE